jgi:hypothetical protein
MAVAASALPTNYALPYLATPYIAADGSTFASLTPDQQASYIGRAGGDVLKASAQWVSDYNNNLLRLGLAVQTPQGVTTVESMRRSIAAAGQRVPSDVQSTVQLYNQIVAAATQTAPMVNNCALCASGQSSACAGCAPATPPGFVTTGTGVPVSTMSGLPLGFRPTNPVSIAGVSLPLWMWGAGALLAYMTLFRGGRRR